MYICNRFRIIKISLRKFGVTFTLPYVTKNALLQQYLINTLCNLKHTVATLYGNIVIHNSERDVAVWYKSVFLAGLERDVTNWQKMPPYVI